MADAFSIEFRFQGQRFDSIVTGLEAFARRQQVSLARLPFVLRREIRDYLDTVAEAMKQRHSTPWAPGRRMPTGARAGVLMRRSGDTFRALARGVSVSGRTLDTIQGTLTGPGHLATHERGAVIRARRARYLTIPLPAALDSRGVPRRPRARDWPNTFVQRTRRGNLIIFQRRGSAITPLYLLRTEVRIPPRLGLELTMRETLPFFIERVADELLGALRP